MSPKAEKDTLHYAVKLAKAVKMVTDALTVNFAAWKSTSFGNKEVIKNMEKTHQLVLDYIYGVLGGKMDEFIDKAWKGKENGN